MCNWSRTPCLIKYFLHYEVAVRHKGPITLNWMGNTDEFDMSSVIGITVLLNERRAGNEKDDALELNTWVPGN